MHDKTGLRETLWMTAEQFDFLLEMVEHFISKQDTKIRLAISQSECLSLTLWFIAIGGSVRDILK